MNGFKDHFSGHAAAYSTARPGYPSGLFAWLAAQAPGRRRAWDCATGNGQAAVALADHFERVIATDASAEQIANAFADSRVEYRVAPAEEPGLTEASVDAVTVAQAVHWFDRPRFYAAVRRILRPGGLIAVWSYGLFTVDTRIDAAIADFYNGPIAPFWPPERRLTDERYVTLDFPFAEIQVPEFHMQHRWTLAQALAYLRTWSAVQHYIARNGTDPVETLAPQLARLWGGAESRDVVWPLYLRAGIRL